MLQTICAILLVIGGLNWGAYGLFTFDLVAWICGGSYTMFARIVYILVGAAAVIWTAIVLMRSGQPESGEESRRMA